MDKLSHTLGTVELQLSGATAIGPYHVQMGLPNQDAYDLIAGKGFLTLAVADGAGSLERSDEGSELAVEVGAGMAADLILKARRERSAISMPELLAEAILEARSALFTLDFWEQAGSTLVLAALSEDSFGVAVLGDSFAVVKSDSELKLVQPPSVGEFANITKLLSSADPTVSICWGPLSELRGLALCSDAFEQSTLEQRVPTEGFWNRVFTMSAAGKLEAGELISFMEGQGKIEDDATLVVLGVSGPLALDNPENSIELKNFSLEEIEELSGRRAAAVPELPDAESDGEPSSRGLPRDF